MISGVLLIAWGIAILVSGAVRGVDGEGAFAAGQMLAWVLALGLVALGVRAVARGRAARH